MLTRPPLRQEPRECMHLRHHRCGEMKRGSFLAGIKSAIKDAIKAVMEAGLPRPPSDPHSCRIVGGIRGSQKMDAPCCASSAN